MRRSRCWCRETARTSFRVRRSISRWTGARWRSACRSAHPSCVVSRDAPEDGAISEPGTAGIVEPEDAADELACGVEPPDRLAVGAQHLRIGVDLQSAEAEGDAAGDR